MSSIANTASTSLVEAINFLTRPLSLTVSQAIINSLQQILLSTLTTVPSWIRNARLTLTFSSAAPPRAIYAACIAANVDWSDWFYALGGREFDLTIERTAVSVQATGISGRAVVWKQAPAVHPTLIPTIAISEPEPKTQVPISKFSQSVKLNKVPSPISIDSILSSNTQPKTVAQQLLQSEHEKEEAEEIFAMISNMNACLISPTPTRECFNIPRYSVTKAPATTRFTRLSTLEEEIFHSHSSFRQAFARDRNTPSPISSPGSSRPSSPSSTFSYSSSQESLTSVSTTSPITAPKKSFIPPAKREFPARQERTRQVLVNTAKNQVQRYLYQGGQSTVLTGGVMLGAAAKTSAPRPSPVAAPKYCVPGGGNKAAGNAQPKSQTQAGSNPGSWRRATASRV